MKYLIIFLLASCAGEKMSFVEGRSTPELEKYVEEFEDTFDTRVDFDVVIVSALSNGASHDGQCYHDGSFRRVEIKETHASGKKLRLMVFHELGHCSLNLDHWDEEADIMNTRPSILVAADISNMIPHMVENYEAGVYPDL